jgi:lysophospholipase L1-like esterase
MLRRTYSKTDGKLQDGLLPYSEAMKSVALEKKAALIDLHSASRELYEKLGQNESDKLAAGPTDQTHFNEAGARAMADLVVKGLPEAAPELAKTLKANKK